MFEDVLPPSVIYSPLLKSIFSFFISLWDNTWTGLYLGEKPNWTQTVQGDAFQFTEVYTPPGLESVSDVTRTIQSESVTDTTTIFSQ